MTDWKQKIEAWIEDLEYYDPTFRKQQRAMQALLNVAVAADTYLVDVQNDESEQALFDALDKLREVSE